MNCLHHLYLSPLSLSLYVEIMVQCYSCIHFFRHASYIHIHSLIAKHARYILSHYQARKIYTYILSHCQACKIYTYILSLPIMQDIYIYTLSLPSMQGIYIYTHSLPSMQDIYIYTLSLPSIQDIYIYTLSLPSIQDIYIYTHSLPSIQAIYSLIAKHARYIHIYSLIAKHTRYIHIYSLIAKHARYIHIYSLIAKHTRYIHIYSLIAKHTSYIHIYSLIAKHARYIHIYSLIAKHARYIHIYSFIAKHARYIHIYSLIAKHTRYIHIYSLIAKHARYIHIYSLIAKHARYIHIYSLIAKHARYIHIYSFIAKHARYIHIYSLIAKHARYIHIYSPTYAWWRWSCQLFMGHSPPVYHVCPSLTWWSCSYQLFMGAPSSWVPSLHRSTLLLCTVCAHHIHDGGGPVSSSWEHSPPMYCVCSSHTWWRWSCQLFMGALSSYVLCVLITYMMEVVLSALHGSTLLLCTMCAYHIHGGGGPVSSSWDYSPDCHVRSSHTWWRWSCQLFMGPLSWLPCVLITYMMEVVLSALHGTTLLIAMCAHQIHDGGGPISSSWDHSPDCQCAHHIHDGGGLVSSSWDHSPDCHVRSSHTWWRWSSQLFMGPLSWLPCALITYMMEVVLSALHGTTLLIAMCAHQIHDGGGPISSSWDHSPGCHVCSSHTWWRWSSQLFMGPLSWLPCALITYMMEVVLSALHGTTLLIAMCAHQIHDGGGPISSSWDHSPGCHVCSSHTWWRWSSQLFMRPVCSSHTWWRWSYQLFMGPLSWLPRVLITYMMEVVQSALHGTTLLIAACAHHIHDGGGLISSSWDHSPDCRVCSSHT